MSNSSGKLIECLCVILSKKGTCKNIDNVLYGIIGSSRVEVEVEDFNTRRYIVSISVNGEPMFRVVDDGSCKCASLAVQTAVPREGKVKTGSQVEEILRKIMSLKRAGVSPPEVLEALVESGVPEDVAIALVEAYFDFSGGE